MFGFLEVLTEFLCFLIFCFILKLKRLTIVITSNPEIISLSKCNLGNRMRKDDVDVQHIQVYMDKFVNFFCEILLLMYKVSYTDHVLSS